MHTKNVAKCKPIVVKFPFQNNFNSIPVLASNNIHIYLYS